MSGCQKDQSNDNVVSIEASDAEAINQSLRSLRDQIVTAWQERAVMLTREEQSELHAEIKQTCEFLMNLTQEA